MASLIEDYAIIGDTQTVALVDRSGSIDWWCVPRIDSGACFAALLGTADNGRWQIQPTSTVSQTQRAYRGHTLVLETEFTTDGGVLRVTDFMLPMDDGPSLFRIVRCVSGRVSVRSELVVRFDYGSIVPWVTATGDGLQMVAGPDGLRFHSTEPVHPVGETSVVEFALDAGEHRAFSLSWYPARQDPPLPHDAHAALERTVSWWADWVSRCTYDGPLRDDVIRSLITLKALTYAPTGALAAAATTSLPEQIGGVRNWDYRYSWLRDTSLTLQALITSGYVEEAMAWNEWLRRAVAGSPGDFQIMYDVYGNRRLTEIELPWLSGYEDSRPVRIGNGASGQFQLDVFGELLDAMLTAASAGLRNPRGHGPDLLLPVLEHLDHVWDQPDDGIWEIRGPRRHFTHSKVMAWVAYDRAVKLAPHIPRGRLPSEPPIEQWAATRDVIHAQVCERGYDHDLGSFVQYYGSTQLDSSLLMLARVGFLPADDPRIVATVEAIQRELVVDGFVQRYPTSDSDSVDGLPAGEGTFLMTTYWLVDNLTLMGRHAEARALFDRLHALRNDVGLFAEEYDPVAGRMLGNFPQAFSHLAFIGSAMNLGGTQPVA